MQVENVARVRLTSGRPAEQQRELAVRLGLFRQVVVDHEGVLAVLHPVLPDRATGVGGEVLERAGRRRGRVDHHRVLHGVVVLECRHHLGHRRSLLADGDVDALHVLAALVDDRVDTDGGLAGLAVTDDQLALAATDRDHAVDGLDAGLERLVDRLTVDHTRRLHFEPTGGVALDRALAVERDAERVDDPTQQPVAHGDREDAPGRLDGVALLDVGGIAEDGGADGAFVEVQRQPQQAAGKFEQLVHRHAGETLDPGDAVADLDGVPDLLRAQLGLEIREVLLEDRRDLAGVDLDVSHWLPSCSLSADVCAGSRSYSVSLKCSSFERTVPSMT